VGPTAGPYVLKKRFGPQPGIELLTQARSVVTTPTEASWLSECLQIRYLLTYILTIKLPGPRPCELMRVISGSLSWRVVRLRMEERPPVWRVAENILKKR
jgi:hypothetical protein